MAIRVAGHSSIQVGPHISINGGGYYGRQHCECGAYSSVLKSNKLRAEWMRKHKGEILQSLPKPTSALPAASGQ